MWDFGPDFFEWWAGLTPLVRLVLPLCYCCSALPFAPLRTAAIWFGAPGSSRASFLSCLPVVPKTNSVAHRFHRRRKITKALTCARAFVLG